MTQTNSSRSSTPSLKTSILIAAVTLLTAGCERTDKPAATAASTATHEWPLNGSNAHETRHTPLDRINASNVSRLGLAWKFDDFVVRGRVHRGNQGTPLVVDGVMYFTGPWSVVYAVDAKTGASLWTYDPQADGAWARKACCDVNNKGVAFHDGRIYVGVVDGFLDAVDAKTGQRAWRVDTLIDRSRSYTVTGAPRLAGKNIVIGNGGGDMDTRGYVSAYDLETGKLAWRFFTVPGDPARGADEHSEITEARKTWGKDSRWDLGLGGNAYDGMAYDPELNVIYVGTSNGVPHPSWLRDPSGGDNLYLSSILALDAGSGKLRWHYQTTPADSWDFGSTQNLILADLAIDGRPRKVIMQAPKNGFFYVLDRASGELLSAKNFATVTWATHVDLKTGRPVLDESLSYQKSPKIIWPSVSGGHNWQPMAFNPGTGLVYIPALEAPMKYVGYDSVTYQPGSLNEGKGPPLMPPFEAADDALLKGQPQVRDYSVLKAWDPVAQQVVWESAPLPWWSGGVLSSGGLIYQGATDGTFNVFDASSGKVLKSISAGLAILAPPISYEIDGEQFIAVLGGLGGSEGAYYPRQAAAQAYENNESLFVFKLDGGPVPLPPVRQHRVKQPLPKLVVADAKTLKHGAELFYHNCARCHSYRGSPGSYPNLWNMTPAAHEAFKAIVLEGAFAFQGMAAFKDILSEADADAIHAFLVKDVLEMAKAGKDGAESRFFELE